MLTAEQEFVRPSRPIADPRATQRRSPAYVRWVQQSLNRILGTRIYVNGVMGPRVSNAVRAFQGRAGLPADGVVGPRTEAALIAAGAGNPPGGAPTAAPGARKQPEIKNIRGGTMNDELNLLELDEVGDLEDMEDMEDFEDFEDFEDMEDFEDLEAMTWELGDPEDLEGGAPPARRRVRRPPPRIVRVRRCAVLNRFAHNRTELQPHHAPQIKRAASLIVASWMRWRRRWPSRPFPPIRVVGHTDSTGSQEYNRRLGMRRAVIVGRRLIREINNVRSGLAPRLIKIVPDSQGELRPVSPTSNRTPAGRALNRRVEIICPIVPE
jgi:peptidoglycan hydrolase-like protein with peptidoglycan-binding domain